MPIDLKPMEAFVLVMRSGSLTKAESLSGVSKATLSRQITKLEEELGTQLLTRTSRRVAPTAAGRAFLVHSEGLLNEVAGRMESARTEMQELSAGVSGTLSLLSDAQFSTSFVCHVVKLFLELHPQVRCQFDVTGRATTPHIDEVDCYVCAEPPDQPNLVAKLLGRLNYGLYASPHYLLQQGAPLSPPELLKHKSIVLNELPDSTDILLVSGTSHYTFRPQPTFETNDYWVMKTFCIAGFGIALLPDFFAQPEVKQGVLVPVLPLWKPEPRRIYCAFQRQRYMGRKVRTFVDLMARCVIDIDSYNYYVGASSNHSQQLPP